MAGPQTGPETLADTLSVVHEAADNFCEDNNPFAPDHKTITAQMRGEPIPQAV